VTDWKPYLPAMYSFNARITVAGRFVIPAVNELEVVSTWKAIGDTARVKLPGLRHKLDQGVKAGDSIKIECGYNGEYVTEFEGFVAEVLPNTPYELRCEDGAYWLKRQTTQGAWRATTLKHVLAHVYPGVVASDVPDVPLSPFRIEAGTSKYRVLERLKEEYGLTIYFRGTTLYAGLAYGDRRAADAVVYHLQKNVVSSDLTFRRPEEVRIGVKAVSIRPGKDLRVQVGDTDGDQVSLHFYNVTTEAALTAMALERLAKMKYERYRGGLIGFGRPFVQHGQAALILDDLYPQRRSRVFVDQVRTTVSKSGGYRRHITLGRKAD
jgi:hypothetical protein